MIAPARRLWPLAAWIVFVLLLSLLPLPLKHSLKTHGRYHNAAHFFAFLITVLLVCWNRGSNAWVVASCVCAMALGLLIEGAQTVVYHNHFEWDDLLVDSAGAIMGGIVFLAYRGEAEPRGSK